MKYLYTGPLSGVTLRDGKDVREVMLHTGSEVDLPATHEYTKTLVALGHLSPVAPQNASTSSDDKGGKSTNRSSTASTALADSSKQGA